MTSSIAFDEDRVPILPVRYRNHDQLYKSFMPFLRNGGLFIPTRKLYKMGQEVSMIVQLPDDENKLNIQGQIAWVTPENATDHKKQGVGVEFIDKVGMTLRSRIEVMLVGRLDSDAPTYTL